MARSFGWVTVGLIACATSLSSQEPAPGDAAPQDDTFRYARVSYVEPSVLLQRAADAEAEEAELNVPLVPGDRVWSTDSGRAEFQFFDGSLVWLSARSKVDYFSGEGDSSGSDRTELRLWSGTLAARTWSQSSAAISVETPSGAIQVDPSTLVRIDVAPDSTRVTVLEGRARVDGDGGQCEVEAGERVDLARGEAPETAARVNRNDADAFDDWVRSREGGVAWASASRRYLPQDLVPYASDFDNYGAWYNDSEVGYVWRPQVDADWCPYWQGHWAWTAYGWTWVPDEPWGWAPFHYGRWGFSVSLGWYWIPGHRFGPAWVSWAIGSRHVGWCALDRWDRPIRRGHRGGFDRDAWRRGRPGHAVPGGRAGQDRDAWLFVNRSDFARRGVARRRVGGFATEGSDVRTFEASRFRPDRRLADTLSARAVPRLGRADGLRSPGSRPGRGSSSWFGRSDDGRGRTSDSVGARRRAFGDAFGSRSLSGADERRAGRLRGAAPEWRTSPRPQTGDHENGTRSYEGRVYDRVFRSLGGGGENRDQRGGRSWRDRPRADGGSSGRSFGPPAGEHHGGADSRPSHSGGGGARSGGERGGRSGGGHSGGAHQRHP